MSAYHWAVRESVAFAMQGRHILAFGALLAVVVWATRLFARANWLRSAMESGGTLYLIRLGVETPRAGFCYAPDCRMVAEQMTKAERANWYCR